jgi:hypothetical protein
LLVVLREGLGKELVPSERLEVVLQAGTS